MATIVTTVRVEITDVRGQESTHERKIVTKTQDNSRYWHQTASMEVDAASGTVLSAIAGEYGTDTRNV